MKLNVKRFQQALSDCDLSVFVLAKRMRQKHWYGNHNTINCWIKKEAADEHLFEKAIDTLNEYTAPTGFTYKRMVPYKVEDFMA